jgi:TRAP transporter TAXI family solute receptor
MLMRARESLAGAVAGVALLGSSVLAADVEKPEALPDQLAWTAYDVGSAGYNQAVAIGSALKNQIGVDLRVLPGKNDVSRQVPLRAEKVDFSATGVGASWMAQEGVFEFGSKDWGPQQVRVLVANNSNANLTVGCAADAGIKSVSDMKGKRIAWVVGSPSLNQNVEAILAFGGLTWDDVEKVEFPGFGQSWDGIINNQSDCAFAVTTSGKAYQLEASPRGIHWPPLPTEDEEGWKRLRSKAPFFVPNKATIGAGVSEENPHHGAAYPYPILIAYADQDDDLVYAMTKAMVELFPHYKEGAPGIEGWALDKQVFDWVVPYHPGAIRYFEEIGVWSEEFQKHNGQLIERQKALETAWEEATAAGVDDAQAFEKVWMEARTKALEAAGFDPIYR